MSIVDVIIYTIDWIFQNTLLRALPTNAAGISYAEFIGYLDGVGSAIGSALSGLGFIFPVELIFSLAVIAIVAEFTLFGFHIILFIVRLVRG
jgi:L-serine deaminase